MEKSWADSLNRQIGINLCAACILLQKVPDKGTLRDDTGRNLIYTDHRGNKVTPKTSTNRGVAVEKMTKNVQGVRASDFKKTDRPFQIEVGPGLISPLGTSESGRLGIFLVGSPM